MKKLLLNILLTTVTIFSAGFAVKAQSTIIPDLSEIYITKLIETAKAHYPRVKSYQNRINNAEGNVSRTKASFFDEFAFSYVYQPHSAVVTPSATAASTLGAAAATAATTQGYSYFNGIQVGFFFNVGNFFEKPYSLKIAKEELNIARNDQAEYLITIATEVRKRYYIYVQRVAELKVQNQSASEAEQLVNVTKHKFEKGEETYENFNRVQATYSDRLLTKIAAETNLMSSRADLEELLGVKLETIK